MPYTEILELIENNDIRSRWHDGEWFYSVIDFVALMRNVDKKQAQNYYHVIKKRLIENRIGLPPIIQIKAISLDGKKRLTDFSTLKGIIFFKDYIDAKLQSQILRREVRQDDEVILFHPRVLDFCQQQGWQTQHHVKLPSGSVIDIVALSEDKTYTIECKPRLTRQKLYMAVGQVLCYQCEYDVAAIPAIASFYSEFNDYAKEVCLSLGIHMIAINGD